MSYLLNHITNEAQKTFDKSSDDPYDHWFKVAQQFHDECVANGLTGTADQVKRIIEHQRKIAIDKTTKI
jgi:hypothetical protein